MMVLLLYSDKPFLPDWDPAGARSGPPSVAKEWLREEGKAAQVVGSRHPRHQTIPGAPESVCKASQSSC